MKIDGGRPVIQGQDYPSTIYNALLTTTRAWCENSPRQEACSWLGAEKLNASLAVRDGFDIDFHGGVSSPNGEVGLDIKPEQLEFSLVAYGCSLVDKIDQGYPVTQELAQVDSILKEMDRAAAHNRHNLQVMTDQLVELCLRETERMFVCGLDTIGA